MVEEGKTLVSQGDDVDYHSFQDASQHQGHMATSLEPRVEKILWTEGLAFA